MEDFDDYLFDHVYFVWRIKEYIVDFFKDTYRFFKYLFQKIFRKNHLSNRDIWGTCYNMAPYILKRLEAFYNLDLMGVPFDFVDYDENEGAWNSYEDYKASGVVGGGEEAWKATIGEMIFAFYFLLAGESEKWRKKFVEKYGLDWEAETPENLTTLTFYETEDGRIIIPSTDTQTDPAWKAVSTSQFYSNTKMLAECSARAQKGFELFGKYYLHLAN